MQRKRGAGRKCVGGLVLKWPGHQMTVQVASARHHHPSLKSASLSQAQAKRCLLGVSPESSQV